MPIAVVANSGAESPAPAPPTRADSQHEITCSYPVQPGDTRATLVERMGDEARVELVGGPEGMDFDALVLWPENPSRRIEVIFLDDAMTERGSVRVVGEASEWRAAGLGLGSSLADVEARNGGPFKLMGFEWDYGGLVMDWLGGKLEDLGGGCRIGAHLGYGEAVREVPSAVLGDVELRSDLSELRGLDLAVAELWVAFED